MTPTPVGMRCPECSRQRTKVKTIRSVASLPYVTYALIAINVVVFLLEQGQFTIAGSGVHGEVVYQGWLARGFIGTQIPGSEHEYWRLVTSAFLHENILHIAFNMYLLYLLGMLLEPALGSLRFAAIYITAMLCGSLGVVIATTGASLGASGAIFGLMGAAAVEQRARGINVMQSGIGTLIIFNLIISLTFAGISIGAHVGGLIGGAIAGLALRAADERTPRYALPLGLAACAATSAVAVAASIAVA
jgi:membrane associated rhomboid family serine protease